MSIKIKIFGVVKDLWDLEQIAKADSAGGSKQHPGGEFTVTIKMEEFREVGNEKCVYGDIGVVVGYYNPLNRPILWRCIPSFVANAIQGWHGNPWMVDGYKFLTETQTIESAFMTDKERARIRKSVNQRAESIMERLRKLDVPVKGIMGSGRLPYS